MTGLKNCFVGIELGFTRIKAVLTDGRGKVLASGGHEWENRLENGLWTYSYEDITSGLQAAYGDLKADIEVCVFPPLYPAARHNLPRGNGGGRTPLCYSRMRAGYSGKTIEYENQCLYNVSYSQRYF